MAKIKTSNVSSMKKMIKRLFENGNCQPVTSLLFGECIFFYL